MGATDAKPVPRKNTAYRVTFPILDADGDLVTGAAALDSEVSIDGAAFADATNEAVEIAAASGVYYLDLTAGEMNGDTIAVIVKTSTSGAKTAVLVLYPEEEGDIRVNVTAAAGTAWASGAITAAAIADGAIDAATFAAGAIDAAALAADAANEIADALLDRTDAIETGLTPRKALRLCAAESGGDVSGGPDAPVFKGAGVATTRITSSATTAGNRTNTLAL